jgi:hypothetical protein
VTKKFEQRLFYVSDTGITAMAAQVVQLEIEDSPTLENKNSSAKVDEADDVL